MEFVFLEPSLLMHQGNGRQSSRQDWHSPLPLGSHCLDLGCYQLRAGALKGQGLLAQICSHTWSEDPGQDEVILAIVFKVFVR
jgi:hypothetical protein